MDRKGFLKNSILATGAILLPNSIWALDKRYSVSTMNLNKFISKPNLKRFKISELGTKFFETELTIQKLSVSLKLNRKYFVSENIKGISTPTLLETTNQQSLIFIPELYKDKKHNGFIVKVYENGICEEQKIFTHENQGYFAFWGKEYLGNPTLYHYNFDTLQLMRMHLENEIWINHSVMQIAPDEMRVLYDQQLKKVTQGKLTQQFGYDFKIHKDGFYQFLALKHGWEQRIIIKEKETYEKINPAKIFTENIITNIKEVNFIDYNYPFVPIYCKGDDLSFATIIPIIIYDEVAGTKIEIPNMPAYKTQDGLGECRAFALATVVQKYICDTWKRDIPDCKNPPADSAISYFGMLAYTNQVVGKSATFEPNQAEANGMSDIINDLSKNGTRLILESCKPFDRLVNNFGTGDEVGLVKRDKFLTYLKNMYENRKNKTEADIADCPECMAEINKSAGLNVNLINLKKALAKDTYDSFLYSLFFDGCKMENFPAGFRAAVYPIDSMDVSVADIKNQIIKGLNHGKPVLFPGLCVSQNKGEDCKVAHSLVISGYKKVCETGSTTKSKDVFKLHNSWGAEWQKMNNEGWVDADVFVQNTAKVKSKDGTYRIGSSSVIWLSP